MLQCTKYSRDAQPSSETRKSGKIQNRLRREGFLEQGFYVKVLGLRSLDKSCWEVIKRDRVGVWCWNDKLDQKQLWSRDVRGGKCNPRYYWHFDMAESSKCGTAFMVSHFIPSNFVPATSNSYKLSNKNTYLKEKSRWFSLPVCL